MALNFPRGVILSEAKDLQIVCCNRNPISFDSLWMTGSVRTKILSNSGNKG
jgi:hypothetical protein